MAIFISFRDILVAACILPPDKILRHSSAILPIVITAITINY